MSDNDANRSKQAERLVDHICDDIYEFDQGQELFVQAIRDHVRVPFDALFLGKKLTVIGFKSTRYSNVKAVYQEDGKVKRAALRNIDFTHPLPDGFEYIDAYFIWLDDCLPNIIKPAKIEGRPNFNVTNAMIYDLADSDAIFARGKAYYQTGKVTDLKIDKKEVIAKVQGTRLYKVNITFGGKLPGYTCSCPYGFGCKHGVAALLALQAISKSKGQSQRKQKKESPISRLTLDTVMSHLTRENQLQAYSIATSGQVSTKFIQGRINSVLAGKKNITVSIDPNNFFGGSSSCPCGARFFTNCVHKSGAALAAMIRNNHRSVPATYFKTIKENLQNEKYEALLSTINRESSNKTGTLDDCKPRAYRPVFEVSHSSTGIAIKVNKSIQLKDLSFGKITSIDKGLLIEQMPGMEPPVADTCKTFLASLDGMDQHWGGVSKARFSNELDFELLSKLRNLHSIDPQHFVNSVIEQNKAIPESIIEKTKEGYIFRFGYKLDGRSIDNTQEIRSISSKTRLWISWKEKNIAHLAEVETHRPLLAQEISTRSGTTIPKKKVCEFIEQNAIKLSESGNLLLPRSKQIKELRDLPPFPRLFLREIEGQIFVELRFLYGTNEISWGQQYEPIEKGKDNQLYRIVRARETESAMRQRLLDKNLIEQDNGFRLNMDPLEWLSDILPALKRDGFEIFGQDSLVSHKLRSGEIQLSVVVRSGIDWFDIKAESRIGEEAIPTSTVFDTLSKGERFVHLDDGTICAMPKKWLDKLAGVTGLLAKDKEGFKAARSQMLIVEAMAGAADSCTVDTSYKELQQKLRKFDHIEEAALPKDLRGSLRDYQKAGYDWLHFLRDFGLGGCLADEMGLGKTVQVLALLLHEKEIGVPAPSLVIVPRTLIFNWVAEIKKFTPQLKAHVHHGNEREDRIKSILKQKPDVIISTYGTLRNDIKMFSENLFNYIILDESQNIKNPFAKSTQSAHQLKAKHRLILTGTPIENTSLDLWSQFAFANPGLLGNREHFTKTFVKTIEQQKDKLKTTALRGIVQPFIMRRTKDAVAKDLPQKQITTLWCEMDDQQRRLYETVKEKFRFEITQKIQNEGMAKSHMKIFEGLMRLRQICNHPAIYDQGYAGQSGKFETIIEQVQEVMEEGHKVLVFSSFVSMLKLFATHFDKSKVPYAYLDGSTHDRQSQVETFQNDEKVKLFLISLKAGGLGLNLTAADYVFIVDPWWNPAAEMQAIDRTHRIGQTKPIFVFKTIMKDSIEEKILALQETKQKLVKDIITVDEGIMKNLTREDIAGLFG